MHGQQRVRLSVHGNAIGQDAYSNANNGGRRQRNDHAFRDGTIVANRQAIGQVSRHHAIAVHDVNVQIQVVYQRRSRYGRG